MKIDWAWLSKIHWPAIGPLVALLAFIIAALGLWYGVKWHNEAKMAELPRLEIPGRRPARPGDVKPAREFVPFGPGLVTPIPFRNSGKREALAKQVILSNGKWERSPPRQDLHGAGEAIHAFFEPRHYVPEKNEYILVLRKPASIPGEQWTTLEVAIVDPNKVGQTYTCTVTLIFDGLEQLQFPDVQIDAMGHPPDNDLHPRG